MNSSAREEGRAGGRKQGEDGKITGALSISCRSWNLLLEGGGGGRAVWPELGCRNTPLAMEGGCRDEEATSEE